MPIINSKIGEDVTIYHPKLVNIYECEISKGCKIGTFVEIQKNVFIGKNTKFPLIRLFAKGYKLKRMFLLVTESCLLMTDFPKHVIRAEFR